MNNYPGVPAGGRESSSGLQGFQEVPTHPSHPPLWPVASAFPFTQSALAADGLACGLDLSVGSSMCPHCRTTKVLIFDVFKF